MTLPEHIHIFVYVNGHMSINNMSGKIQNRLIPKNVGDERGWRGVCVQGNKEVKKDIKDC